VVAIKVKESSGLGFFQAKMTRPSAPTKYKTLGMEQRPGFVVRRKGAGDYFRGGVTPALHCEDVPLAQARGTLWHSSLRLLGNRDPGAARRLLSMRSTMFPHTILLLGKGKFQT